MKKGLSKILSLACVFALLMTMMVPAFAEETVAAKKVEVKDLPAGATLIPAKDGEDKVELTSYGDKNDKFGVFVKVNNMVKFLSVNETTGAAGAALTGKQTIGGKTYLFNGQGYLQAGNAEGVQIWREESGDNSQYLVGYEDGKVLDKTVTLVTKNPEKYFVATSVGSENNAVLAGNTYYVEGKASEGKVKTSSGSVTVYQQKNESGIIELITGVVDIDASADGYGTELTKAHKELYAYAPTDDKDIKVSDIKQITDPGEREVILTIKKDSTTKKYVADKKATFMLDDNGNVLTDDGQGNKIIKSGNNYYLTDDMGAIIKNTNTNKGTQLLGNVYKYDGNKTDFGKEYVVKIGDYDQKFYIPADSSAIATDYYRYVPTSDGQDYEGISYYNDNGITYAGWVLGANDTMKYQTIIRRAGQDDIYILVTGLQYLDEGADPSDLKKTIDAGWYLFDEDGNQVKGNGTVTMGGKKYVLNAGKVATVDGAAPKL